MPIRFRCAYCNQLMGIARRKAGTVVKCPKCAGQVIVPDPGPDLEPPAPKPPAKRNDGKGPELFERSDFEKVFDMGKSAPAPPGGGPAPFANLGAGEAGFDVEPISVYEETPSGPRGPGLFLTPLTLTLVSVGVVLLIGIAFFVGLLVGRG